MRDLGTPPHRREFESNQGPMSASQRGENDVEGRDHTNWLIVIHENFEARSGMRELRDTESKIRAREKKGFRISRDNCGSFPTQSKLQANLGVLSDMRRR